MAEARRLSRVSKEMFDGRAECGEVAWVVDEEAMLAGGDLVDDAADRAGNHGPGLPHGLCHRESEALGQALLTDHGGVALEGIDDCRSLVGIGHRHAGEVHTATDGVRELPPKVG